MFYYYSGCLYLGKTKENFTIVGVIYLVLLIHTGYFTSIMQPTIHFRISEKSWLLFSFFWKWLNTNKRLFNINLMHEKKITCVSFSMFTMSLKVFIILCRFLRYAFTSQIQQNQQKIATEQIKTATRSKLITFKTRETQNKAVKMKFANLNA
jgi:hypothetical protein